jgi:putative colanic acid biosynthesis acetyltransferase WcaF
VAITYITPPDAADRCRRVLWQIAWQLAYRWSPTPFHFWRRFVLRLWGAKVGAGAHPYPSARIWAPWNLTMEEGSCLGPGADCYNVAHVTLGKDCVISQKAYLCTASHDIRDASFPLTGAPITIEAGAWVAASAFIGPDVTVGEQAVLAACAVVIRDVNANDIVGGNPASVIGQRKAEVSQ